jgi:hypothetical protein
VILLSIASADAQARPLALRPAAAPLTLSEPSPAEITTFLMLPLKLAARSELNLHS